MLLLPMTQSAAGAQIDPASPSHAIRRGSVVIGGIPLTAAAQNPHAGAIPIESILSPNHQEQRARAPSDNIFLRRCPPNGTN